MLQRPEMGDLIDEQDSLVGFMYGPGDHPLVSGLADLGVPAVRIVADIAEELGL